MKEESLTTDWLLIGKFLCYLFLFIFTKFLLFKTYYIYSNQYFYEPS